MSSKYLFGIVLLGLVCGVISHSYVTSPTSRSNQKQTTTGCRGSGCLGPCDVPVSKIKRDAITVARGASLTIQWPRNNHAGGFIRFAWAPTDQSDSHSAFDNNVQQINCHEVGGCHPDDSSDPNGGDSGPADGSSRACSTTLRVPAHLTDGKWTLQWAWYGGAYELGDYYSCIDYQISGGASGASVSPVFVGGDFAYPGQQKCKYFNTDRLHRCVNEPCNNPVYPSGQRSGPAYLPDGASPVPATTGVQTTSKQTTGVQTTSKQTTGVQTTSKQTTGVQTTSKQTTGVQTTSKQTTGVQTTSKQTTGVQTTSKQTTTGTQTQATTGDSTCVDEIRCFNSTATQRCYNNNLLDPQVCQTNLVCKVSPSSKYAYCVRAGDTVRNDGSVDSAAAAHVHPTWIALALFAIFMML